MNIGLETIKFSIFKNISTGSIVFDSILISLVISILGYIGSFMGIESFNNVYVKVIKCIKSIFYKQTVSVEFESWLFINQWNKRDIIPNKLHGILHHINNLDYKQYNIKNLIHDNCCENSDELKQLDNYSLYDNITYIIGNDIYYSCSRELFMSTDKDGKIYKKSHNIFSLKEKNINYLIDFINKSYQSYKEYIKSDTDTKQYVFRYKEKNEDGKYIFDEFEFETNRSFDNIYHPQRDEIKKKIMNFINDKDNKDSRYIKFGDDYSLGILLYGEPGCGKTSMIKAIAKLTDRHIVELKLSNIKTFTEFSSIFLSPIINDRWIINSKKIILIEDIDCMIDLVKKRGEPVVEKIESTKKDNEIISQLLMKETGLKIPPKCQELTLSDMLNTIQGIVERTGGMLLISTNHPEKLDSALIRDGRIDLKIKFEKCNKKCMQKMLNDKYGLYQGKVSTIDIDTLPDKKWQYAEIKVILETYDNITDALNHIVHKEPIKF